MSDFEKQMLRNQKAFTLEMLKYMKQHGKRLQKIEQYNLQLVAIFDQAAGCIKDV
ncbi:MULTISPECIES: hypothetical protein [Halocynthiibacter]|uniref:Uncharacterized protein n=1 Tax=Halocynthiibacter halioticoli TaxID=2986804 RepID=A0AAE3J1X9_9RHOB|nr:MULTISPECIES: hypothetical protein [Halocynthiibacter]MCV6825141.1 hypothetical protein [Halocynthiibacter halioticoli]MCW4058142.1 hypothetical protein [Halocynthiibacter sp. SDUM655004]